MGFFTCSSCPQSCGIFTSTLRASVKELLYWEVVDGFRRNEKTIMNLLCVVRRRQIAMCDSVEMRSEQQGDMPRTSPYGLAEVAGASQVQERGLWACL